MTPRLRIIDDRRGRSETAAPSEHELDLWMGRRLRLRRTVLGLSREELAVASGVSPQQIHNYETGQSRLSVPRVVAFSRVLDVPVAWFFDGLESGHQTASDNDDTPHEVAAVRLVSIAHQIKSKQRLRQLVEFARLLAEEDDQPL